MGQFQLYTNAKGLTGKINIPGDKSISHRAVMFGSIANGTTTITNFLLGEDCLSTISCFQKLGVDIHQEEDRITIVGRGLSGLQEPSEVLDVGNSGTTIRLLMGILAGRAFHATLVGDHSIGRRPMTRVTIPLSQMGAQIDGRKNGEFVPISIRGKDLTGINYTLPVASAQIKSSILFAGLQASGMTTLHEPAKSRDHTERMIRQFGGEAESSGLTVKIKGPQQLTAADVYVPGDISSAAFFLVAGAIVPNSEIVLKNVGLNPTRTGIIDVMKAMGANISISAKENNTNEPIGDIRIQSSKLTGTVIEGELIPRLIDEIPIIALLATQATGKTIIKDAHELKVKETNRIDTVVNELSKLGAAIEATSDGMIIYGNSKLTSGKVASHGDHRIGMMLSIAALVSSGQVILDDAEAIAVSYPEFFKDLNSLL